MSTRGKGTALVTQGGTMSYQSETPVLTTSNWDEIFPKVGDVVGFLRLGCPSVQLQTGNSSWLSEDGNSGRFHAERVEERVARCLKLLEKPREQFRMTAMWSGAISKHNPQTELKWPTWQYKQMFTSVEQTVMVITRKVALETVDTTFGEVPDDHDFLAVWPADRSEGFSQECRCVKRRVHQQVELVPLEGHWRGIYFVASPVLPVKLIVE